jgi:hypothetical protein
VEAARRQAGAGEHFLSAEEAAEGYQQYRSHNQEQCQAEEVQQHHIQRHTSSCLAVVGPQRHNR